MVYYDNYCYLPLYCFSGSWPLIAKLRPSNIDPSLGTLEALEKIIPRIRRRFPDVQILLRADSGFMRDKILTWCEENGVKYVIGMARNNRLVGPLEKNSIKPGRNMNEPEQRLGSSPTSLTLHDHPGPMPGG
jgi:hypothetical protein